MKDSIHTEDERKAMSQYSEFQKRLSPQELELFAKFYPRKYQAPATHYSPKMAASVMTAISIAQLSRKSLDFASSQLLSNATRAACIGMPTYWVNKDFVELMLEADLPTDFAVKDIVWPMDVMLVLLPIGAIRDATGSPCMWLSISRIGKDVPLMSPYFVSSKDSFAGMCVVAHASSGTSYASSLPIDTAIKNYGDLENFQSGGDPSNYVDGDTSRTLSTPKQDTDFIGRMVGLSVNILMYLMAAKDSDGAEKFTALHTGDLLRKPKPAKGIDELWAPSWIGRDYKHPESCRSLGGTHASPRTHWRRAHFRRVPYGPMDVTPRPFKSKLMPRVMVAPPT